MHIVAYQLCLIAACSANQQCKITTFLLVANLAGMRLSASSKQTCFLYILMTDYLFFTSFGNSPRADTCLFA